MAFANPEDDLPYLIMGFTAQQHRIIRMNKILSFLNERNYSRYNKGQLLRRLYEVESDGRVPEAKQQAINLWFQRGSIGPIDVYYNQNEQSQQPQTPQVRKRKRSIESVYEDYIDVLIKNEDLMESELQPELKPELQPEPQIQMKPELRECSICVEDLELADFPHHISAECMHDPTCCNSCISRSISMQIEIKQWDQIACPECVVLLSFWDVKFFASETDFIRYDENSLSSCIRRDPNFTNCLGPACSGGQIHDGGDDQPIMTCGTCSFKTCFTHKMPWHPDLTCDDYDVQSRIRLREEEESQILINTVTKRCPNCQVRIEKNRGCDHMVCKFCKYEFCWICFVDYELIRSRSNAEHQLTCPHYREDPPRYRGQFQAMHQYFGDF